MRRANDQYRDKGLICLISSTGSLGTAGQLNYSSSKAGISIFPKVLTAEFFRRGLADKIRVCAVAPGYVGTPMVKKIPEKALSGILDQVPIGRLVEPEEVASLVGELYRNEGTRGRGVLHPWRPASSGPEDKSRSGYRGPRRIRIPTIRTGPPELQIRENTLSTAGAIPVETKAAHHRSYQNHSTINQIPIRATSGRLHQNCWN